MVTTLLIPLALVWAGFFSAGIAYIAAQGIDQAAVVGRAAAFLSITTLAGAIAAGASWAVAAAFFLGWVA